MLLWKYRLLFGQPAWIFQQKIQTFLLLSHKLLKEIQNLFGENTSSQKGPLTSQTILRKLQKNARCGKISAPSSETFQKQKKLTEKANTYRCSYGHSDCNFNNPDETLGRQFEKNSLNSQFLPLVFLSTNTFSSDLSSGHNLTTCFGFVPNEQDFVLQAWKQV